MRLSGELRQSVDGVTGALHFLVPHPEMACAAEPADPGLPQWRWLPVALNASVPPLSCVPALRAHLDHAVLRVVQSADVQAAAKLSRICAGLAAAQNMPEPRIVWALAAGFFEAMALSLLPLDRDSKRMASRVLQQYMSLAKGLSGSDERMARDLVFFCAQVRPASDVAAPALRAVRVAYGLLDSVPVRGPSPARAQESDQQTKVIGDLRLDLASYNVFLTEADEWSRRLITGLGARALALDRPMDGASVALALALGDSSAAVGFVSLSQLARALAHALEHVKHHGRGDARHAQVFNAAADDIRRLLHQFAAGFLKAGDAQVLQDLQAILTTEQTAPVRPHPRLLQLRSGLGELGDTVDRLRQQLHDLEVQTELPMQSRLVRTRLMAATVSDLAKVQRNLQGLVEGAQADLIAADTELKAEATPAQGALPVVRAVAVSALAPLVLVVDDSITVRRVMQRLLKREGLRVALANDGLHALEVLAQEKPAVLLSDSEMPRMDGFELVRHIRGNAHLRDLPVIMITSRTDVKYREQAMDLGVDHYLGKPYSEEALLALIRAYCAVAGG